MEKTILSKKVSITTAPVHIAPGGSVLFHLVASSNDLKKLLLELREEIAYGMADIDNVDAESSVVRVDIYMGMADVDDFMKVFSRYADAVVSFEREDLAEGSQRTGFSMGSRNDVIECL